MLGELVQTTAGKWITRPPTRCPKGRSIGAANGSWSAISLPRARRRKHHLDVPQCDQTVFGPPLNTHCTALDGPATVRISNARALADELCL